MRAGHNEWSRPGPDGEIGRRSGLKIRGDESPVGVQVSLRAPELPIKNAGKRAEKIVSRGLLLGGGLKAKPPRLKIAER
jgi:hypothetical protein